MIFQSIFNDNRDILGFCFTALIAEMRRVK
jgi:hypothetical protein